MSASLSGYTASITNSVNSASTAALAVSETYTSGGTTTTCNSYDSTATCSTINKYGGTASPLVPGGSQTTKVTFTNTGSVPVGTASMKGGTCDAIVRPGVTGAVTPTTPNTSAGNLCSVLTLQVYKAATATGTAIYTGSLSGFQTATATDIGTLAVGASQDYTFVVTLPTAATTATQGQQVTQPIVWTFNQ
ncbi:hypothetical protein [Nocardioides sp.]|uniref:hypothetical protein n=1 Tax=Nocardioides sp. TaxID=35761 RepID=UPI00271C6C9D|nr:hypothetical protein [Nocardioides sp.]MDO9456905.1 hypothetical protein [Nocardioides sp.]